jgi:large subunit ribosomal protein L1
MGKIRVRTLGEESLEKKQKEKSKQKSRDKKLTKAPGMKGGERIVSVGPSEEELAALEVSKEEKVSDLSKRETKKVKTKKFKKEKKASRSKSYQTVAKIFDRSKKYNLTEALNILEKLKRSKFDETVELHINTIETGISGNITLPYGTGKVTRVAIANDDVLAKVAQGRIDFDILLAAPNMMPKLARVAKFLGPRGLMPNPKNGTLTQDPKKVAENFKKGQMNFKTEAKAPIVHLTVGKLSYGAKKLSENIQTLIETIKKEKIRSVTLKSTMSPGVRVKFD